MRAAAAALPSSDRGGSSGIDGATAAGRAVGRAVEPLLAALRWLQSRLLALLGWLRLGLRLGRRAPVMGVVLPVGCNPNLTLTLTLTLPLTLALTLTLTQALALTLTLTLSRWVA